MTVRAPKCVHTALGNKSILWLFPDLKSRRQSLIHQSWARGDESSVLVAIGQDWARSRPAPARASRTSVLHVCSTSVFSECPTRMSSETDRTSIGKVTQMSFKIGFEVSRTRLVASVCCKNIDAGMLWIQSSVEANMWALRWSLV